MLGTALLCLALNVFHEARGESLEGQIAVAHVTHNRAQKDPKNYCKVVYAKGQFSWVGKVKPADKKSEAWKQAVAVAKTFWFFEDKTKGSTFYHATYVKPNWRKTKKYAARIGTRIFYREV